MSGLTWLHLSDWHQRGTELDIDHKVVRDALIDDIKKRREVHPDLDTIDFIIFSGDLAFSGKKEEYLTAEKHLLKPVLEATGLKEDRLFIVPGNHDLDRDSFDLLPKGLTNPLTEDKEIKEWLDNEKKRSKMLEPFEAYNEFINAYGGGGLSAFASKLLIEKKGKQIALLGFNSALMCGRNKNETGEIDDKNKIILGEPQIYETLRQHQNADLRVVVLHHPFEWLTEQDCITVESRLKQGADFILCGHQHRPKATMEIGTMGNCLIIPAGASYERRNTEKYSYPNAYNFVHLDFPTKKGSIYLRCWSESSNKWREDIDTYKNGRFDFPQGKYLTEQTKERVSDVTTPISTGVVYTPENPVFNVPFNAKGDGMVGREEALQRVREQLTAGKRTAIGHTAAFQGLGGLGKTQLAVEYAHRFRTEYPLGVVWINADQEIEPQLIQIARKGKWIHPDSKPADILEVAIERLKTRSECLVIFDNVEEKTSIEPYLPAVGAEPHLLLTSRAPQPGFTPIDIALLDDERSLQLLLKESGREFETLTEIEMQAASEIVGKLGGLPLAIEIAGAYLNYLEHCTFQEYRGYLEDNLKEALKGDMLSSFTGHETDLYITLQVSKPVLNRAPVLNDILDILAWSGTAFMGISLLTAMLAKKEAELFTPLKLGESLHLLQKSPEGKRYDIHRLLRKVRQEQSPLQHREEWIKETCKRLGDWFEERGLEYTHLPAIEAELDHLKQWLGHVKSISKIQAARLTWLQFSPPTQWGKYLEAHKIVQSAFALLSESPEDEPQLKANILNDLGATYFDLGNYQQALEFDKQALEIRRELFGEKHPDTAISFNNVGLTYGDMGDHQKALEFKLKALEIRRELFGETHPDTAKSFSSVGVTYGNLGDHKKGLEYQLRALEIRREFFGKTHPDTATSFNNVGTTYGHLGDHQKALEFKYRALEVLRELFGEMHPNTAKSFNNVGSTYGDLGDHQKALEFKLRALEIQRELFGEIHPHTATSFNNVGMTYGNLGDHQKALEFKYRALEVLRELFGEMHPNTANSLHNIGSTYWEMGNPDETLAYSQRAFELRDKLLGKYHQDTAASFHYIIYSLIKLKRFDEAGEHLEAYLEELPEDNRYYKDFIDLKRLLQNEKQKQKREGLHWKPKKKRKKK